MSVIVMVKNYPYFIVCIVLLQCLSGSLDSFPDNLFGGGVLGSHNLWVDSRQGLFVFRVFFDGLKVILLGCPFA